MPKKFEKVTLQSPSLTYTPETRNKKLFEALCPIAGEAESKFCVSIQIFRSQNSQNATMKAEIQWNYRNFLAITPKAISRKRLENYFFSFS